MQQCLDSLVLKRTEKKPYHLNASRVQIRCYILLGLFKFCPDHCLHNLHGCKYM